MAKEFKVELVTPERVMVDQEVEEVIAPGIMGEFGVLIGHTPMLTFIKPGVFSYLENDKFTRFAVGAGFCEVLKDKVTVLVEEAYSAEEVDATAASAQVTELEKELASIDSIQDPVEFERVSNKLKVERAKVSLKSAG
jgi:F-type H+-transporting ATPase subunit epsilon